MEEYYPSGVNYVSLEQNSEIPFIRKRYEVRLREYPEDWPLTRGDVEAEILKLLNTLTEGTPFRVPRLLSREPPDLLTMEFCPGERLRDLPLDRLPDRTLWSQLFDLLHRIQLLPWESLSPSLQSALDGQWPIWDCMRRWKTSRNTYTEPPHTCLCLGDVSLNNLLFDGNQICLIDFECTHWGCMGYDGGLLLAAAGVRWADLPVLDEVTAGFQSCRADEDWKQSCLFWRERLWDYYYRNRKLCP